MWMVGTVVFILYFVTPHDPARLIAGKDATTEMLTDVRRRLGLDQPMIQQYGSYLWRLLHGNLGYSYFNSEPVSTIVGEDLPVTASLAVGGAVIWLVIGVLAGVLAATKPRSVADRTVTALALFFYSMPTFLLGELFLLLLFFRLHLLGFDFFPGSGYVGLTQSVGGWAQHMILPWFTLALVTGAVYARLTRGSMLDVLGEDYVRTARAKGLSERSVVLKHSLKNALIPVMTIAGIDLGALMGGAILTETVFARYGVGLMVYQAIGARDLPVVVGGVLFATFVYVIANLVVDVAYAYVDPRIRYE
jgi:peptide/nickel transport system permease protein